jgi:hypothetical protein
VSKIPWKSSKQRVSLPTLPRPQHFRAHSPCHPRHHRRHWRRCSNVGYLSIYRVATVQRWCMISQPSTVVIIAVTTLPILTTIGYIILYVHYICTLYMYIIYVHYICTLYMYIIYVHYISQCLMFTDLCPREISIPMIVLVVFDGELQ